jgi:hypothetical protein
MEIVLSVFHKKYFASFLFQRLEYSPLQIGFEQVYLVEVAKYIYN